MNKKGLLPGKLQLSLKKIIKSTSTIYSRDFLLSLLTKRGLMPLKCGFGGEEWSDFAGRIMTNADSAKIINYAVVQKRHPIIS